MEEIKEKEDDGKESGRDKDGNDRLTKERRKGFVNEWSKKRNENVQQRTEEIKKKRTRGRKREG